MPSIVACPSLLGSFLALRSPSRLVVYTGDLDGSIRLQDFLARPIRLKVNGYVSESVQSDIKLSFTCILFF